MGARPVPSLCWACPPCNLPESPFFAAPSTTAPDQLSESLFAEQSWNSSVWSAD